MARLQLVFAPQRDPIQVQVAFPPQDPAALAAEVPVVHTKAVVVLHTPPTGTIGPLGSLSVVPRTTTSIVGTFVP